jgi:hypothetical protein
VNHKSSSTHGSETRPGQRLLFLLVGFVGLFVAGEVILRAVGAQTVAPYGKTMYDYNLLYTRAADQHDRGKRLCVLVGDSRVEWGVSPEVIQHYLESLGVTDVEVFNLAFPGANVRKILAAFLEAGFYPDYLLVGYSHLSFYWSLVEFSDIKRVHQLTIGENINHTLHTWLSEHVLLLGPWTIDKQLERIRDRQQHSWIAKREISERGQALITYAISEKVAIQAQKRFYEDMYRVPLSNTRVAEINEEFGRQVGRFKSQGARLLLLRMPVAGWALREEQAHNVYPPQQLASELDLPLLDLNEFPGMLELQYYDGLHVAPASSAFVSEAIAQGIRATFN